VKSINKAVLFAVWVLLAGLPLIACRSNHNVNSAGSAISSVFEQDRDNDGVVDVVYYYTYNIAGNEIKLEIDTDNDGAVNKVYCYNLENDFANRPFLEK